MTVFAIAHLHAFADVAAVSTDAVYFDHPQRVRFAVAAMASHELESGAFGVDGMRGAYVGGLLCIDQPGSVAVLLYVVAHQGGFGLGGAHWLAVAAGAALSGRYPREGSVVAQ